MRSSPFFLPPLSLLLATLAAPSPPDARRVAPNDNRAPAGTLRDGVLSLSLEARIATWHPDGDSLPGLRVEAFGEAGRPTSAPGPFVRVLAGTELRFRVRNALERDTLTFYVPSRIADTPRVASDGVGLDSVVLAPGERREIRLRAARPGTYLYHANGRSTLDRALRMRGLLAGAIVVDSLGAPPPRDRVLVLLDAVDSVSALGVPLTRREVTAVNGRSWPHTERLAYAVGDTVRWRVLNATPGVHPMHLHGFYFRVDAFDGPPAAAQAAPPPGRMAVTERMPPFASMTVAWVPERAGNWLFHCHFQPHAAPHRPLGPAPNGSAAARPHEAHLDHARQGMGGLVMGVHVRPRGAASAPADAPRRRLRLVAVRDSGFPDAQPSMRFVLEEPTTGRRADAGHGFSPTIDLARGEPASVIVVNQLREPLSVHWHGIELESYYDGVAGFAGAGRRLAPLIAPNDSFVARMAPPRSGTFIYHSHVDEERHHRAGLVGAIVVRDAGADTAAERLLFIKSARGSADASRMEVNGRVDPDTLVLRVGRPYRLRVVNLAVTSPNAAVYLTARPDSSLANVRDTMLVRWRPVAKDGAGLPERDRVPRPAAQSISIGETYDMEFVPAERGALRLEVRPPALGRLTVRVPIRVE